MNLTMENSLSLPILILKNIIRHTTLSSALNPLRSDFSDLRFNVI